MAETKDLFVALIPDGGRRAVGHDVGRYSESYERGAEVVGDILKACVADSRVKIFTAWGLSDDNALKRSAIERGILNRTFHSYLARLRHDLTTEVYRDVKVVHMGNPNLLDPEVYDRIVDITEFTKDRRREKIFGLCLGYGSHDEEDRAIASYAQSPDRPWREYLDLPYRGNLPYQPVDLIVRTGTDPLKPYTSGYLLPYQGSKTQERYSAAYLPDFSAERFMEFVDDVTIQKPRQGA